MDKEELIEEIIYIEDDYEITKDRDNREILNNFSLEILKDIKWCYKNYNINTIEEFVNKYNNYKNKEELLKKFIDLFHFMELSNLEEYNITNYYKVLIYYTRLKVIDEKQYITDFKTKFNILLKNKENISKVKEYYYNMLNSINTYTEDEKLKEALKETLEYFLIDENYIKFINNLLKTFNLDEVIKFIISENTVNNPNSIIFSFCNYTIYKDFIRFYIFINSPLMSKKAIKILLDKL